MYSQQQIRQSLTLWPFSCCIY